MVASRVGAVDVVQACLRRAAYFPEGGYRWYECQALNWNPGSSDSHSWSTRKITDSSRLPAPVRMAIQQVIDWQAPVRSLPFLIENSFLTISSVDRMEQRH
jgi:hypothetical protein